MDVKKIEEFRKQIRTLEREILEQLKQCTACCDVSLAQCHTLLEIGYLQKTNISELAEILKLDKSTLSRTIDGLVHNGLVSREINPEDRRYMCIKLTEQGLNGYHSVNTMCNRFYQSVFTHIHEENHAQIMESILSFTEAIRRTREEESMHNLELNKT